MLRYITILFSLLFTVQVFAQSAGLLPNALQQYLDNNGNPLSSGTVTFYVPNTTTLKNVWRDANESVLWSNPITLDAGGKPPGSAAGIYGQGTYRQIVKDRNGNIVWDAVTSAAGGSGTSPAQTGDGDLVGTVKPWSGLIAPNQYVFAYGQELSRTTYSVLLTAVTQVLTVTCTSSSTTLTGISDTTQIRFGAAIELSCLPPGSVVTAKTSNSVTVSNPSNVSISASATFFPYGNGNGTTTFNVPDLRGQVVAGRNNMGGIASANLTTTYYNGYDPNSLGAPNNSLDHTTLSVTNLPTFTPSGTITPTGLVTYDRATASGTVNYTVGATTQVITGITQTPTDVTLALSSVFSGNPIGSTTPFSNLQPTITLNYIVKVTPDTNSAIASGVTSLGGMTGSIACGSGLICTGNIISATAGLIPTGNINGLLYFTSPTNLASTASPAVTLDVMQMNAGVPTWNLLGASNFNTQVAGSILINYTASTATPVFAQFGPPLNFGGGALDPSSATMLVKSGATGEVKYDSVSNLVNSVVTFTGTCPIRGTDNLACGTGALSSIALSTQNTAIGINSQFSLTSGLSPPFSTAIGGNTATGHSSLYHNTNGIENVASGFSAGYNLKGFNPTFNVAFWVAGTTYALGTQVYCIDNTVTCVGVNNVVYTSLANGNVGHNPPTSGAFWSTTTAWNVATTYAIGNVVFGADNYIYTSATNGNIGNNPVLNSGANWTYGGTWAKKSTLNLRGSENLISGADALYGTSKGSYVMFSVCEGLTACQWATHGSELTAVGADAGLSWVGTVTDPVRDNTAMGANSQGGDYNPIVADGGSCVEPGTYSAVTTYSLNDVVIYPQNTGMPWQGVYYISLANSNLNNTPNSSPSQWHLTVRTCGLPVTGSDNTTSGADTMIWATSASSNSAFGRSALFGGVSLNNLGVNELRITGGANSAFGGASLHGMTSGSFNNGIGYGAGLYVSSGNYNTLIGYFSGAGNAIAANNLTTGSSNIRIGHESTTGSGIITGSNNLIVGNNVSYFYGSAISTPTGTLIGDASNYVVIGNGAGATRLSFDGNGYMFYNKFFGGTGSTLYVDNLGQVLGVSGTTTQVLHGNAAGVPSYSAVSLTADVTGTLPSANGGTASTFFAVAGLSASTKTFTFPNANASVLTSNAAVTVAQGGTSQITALAARGSTGLNVEAFTGHGDSIYTILATDRVVGTNAALTASRAWTLPAASAVNAGGEIIIADFQGTVTGTNTIVITRAGADTINGGTTVTINTANGAYVLISDGTSKWTAQAIGSATTAGVSTVGGISGAVGVANGIEASGANIQITAARRTLPTTCAGFGGTCPTSGTNATYTTPANTLWIEIYLLGAGGGGGGSGATTAPTGATGGNTCWNTSGTACTTPVLQASGGTGGPGASTSSGTGGSGNSGSTVCSTAFLGADGGPGTGTVNVIFGGAPGGAGGGGFGNTVYSPLVGPASGGAAPSFTGSGGGGASSGSAASPGSGAGGGGLCHHFLNSPAASYVYTVGAGGAGGIGTGTGAATGGAGAGGRIIVIEHYGT